MQKEMKFVRKITGYSVLDHTRNEFISKELKVTAIAELTTVTQKSAAEYKSNGTLQTTKSDASLCPQKKTVKRGPKKNGAILQQAIRPVTWKDENVDGDDGDL
jgi:hypothetical protein